jgi:MoaA/NifB/PqqE/SkfB family radical SAM enzyme
MLTPNENRELTRRERDAGLVRLDSSPATLTIESTSICNLRCVMCPHAIDGVNRPKHMSEDLIARLAAPLAAAHDIQLHGIGEPLASPAFWRALESEALHPDCIVNVNTNLTLLNDRRLALLVGSKADLRLNVSVDAATSKTYERIRGAEFEELLTNIRRLVAARADRPRPMIYINMTLMRENIEEAPRFVELAHALGVDGVCLWQLNHWPDDVMDWYKITRSDWHFDYAKQGLWNFPELSNVKLREAQQRAHDLGLPLMLDGFKDVFFEVPPADATPQTAVEPAVMVPAAVAPAVEVSTTVVATAAPAPHPTIETVKDCRAPWEWGLVSTNGDVRPCCFASAAIGNLDDGSFREIWNSEAAQQLRQDILADTVNRVCRNASCKYVQNMAQAADAQSPARRLRKNARSNLRRLARPVWRRLPMQYRRRILDFLTTITARR